VKQEYLVDKGVEDQAAKIVWKVDARPLSDGDVDLCAVASHELVESLRHAGVEAGVDD